MQAGLDALTHAEAQVIGLEVPERRFRWVQRWLMAEDALFGNSGGHCESPGIRQFLGMSGLDRWLIRSRARLAPRIVARSSADAILFKANLRSFYVDRRLSIKVANPGRPASLPRLNSEVAARRSFVASEHASAPKLRLGPDVVPGGFLAEDLILAEPSGLEAVGPFKLAEWLLGFYEANGLDPKPVGDPAVLRGAWACLRAYASGSGLALSGSLARRVDALLNESTHRHAAEAICNGDLSTTNLLFRGDHVFITDWEWLVRGPVFLDAVRLGTQLPGFAEGFVAAFLRRMAGDPSMLAAADQYLLASILVAQHRIGRRADFVAERDRSAYARRLKPRIAKIVRLMEGLRQ